MATEINYSTDALCGLNIDLSQALSKASLERCLHKKGNLEETVSVELLAADLIS